MRRLSLLALLLLAPAARGTAQAPAAQKQTWLIYADSTNIAADSTLGPQVYVTWVYAKATPTSWPSSAILVAWDCANAKVKRLAQVRYEMNKDSTGVHGPVTVVDRPWQEITNTRLSALVCSIGPTHRDESRQPAVTTYPDGNPGGVMPEMVKPKSQYPIS